MLGAVGLKLKMMKFFRQHLWMLHDVVVTPFGQFGATVLRLGMRTRSFLNS